MTSDVVAEIPHSGRDRLVRRPGSPILAGIRAAEITFFALCALLEICLTNSFVRRNRRAQLRAEWLHRWCKVAGRIVGLRLVSRGEIPRAGLLVCNHLSYLDIIALSSLRPCVFVAKRDVRGWPIFGWLASAAGTIYVDRTRRVAAADAAKKIKAAIDAGLLVVLFPEGTSSDGATVLPFKSALLEPATQCQVGTAGISYQVKLGSVGDEVCYWRDMTLVPHLLNLLTKPEVFAGISFSPMRRCEGNRKEIARYLREEVIALRR